MSAAPQTILVVEDDPTARKLYRVTLESQGYRVLEAFDGRAALEQLARERPDLVLQDLVLPDVDGVELARRLRAQPGGAGLVIIAMSGFPRLLARARGETGCFDASLVKPVSPAVLLEVIGMQLPDVDVLDDELGRGKTILIVDDDPVQLKLLQLRFAALGFTVVTAANTEAALDHAKIHPPDIVLCDVLMPGIDGYELCVALRRVPALALVPIVLHSAHYDGARDEELARIAGASALVTRSPTLDETLEAVRANLGRTAVLPAPEPEFDERHADRVIAQLGRQLHANLGLAERSALQSAQLAVLAGIADALTRSEDIETALGDVLAACFDAGGIARGALFRVDAHDRLTLSFALGFPSEETEAAAALFGFPGLLEPTKRGAIVLPHEHLSARDTAELLDRAGVRIAVVVPIMEGAVRLGAIFMGTNLAEASQDDLATFGRSIGAHIARALALASAFTRLRDSAEASRIMSSSLDMGETLASLGELATRHLAELCEVCIESTPPALRVASALPVHVHAELAELGARFPGRPLLSSGESAAHGELGSYRRAHIGPTLAIPLQVAGRALGMVTLARLRGGRGFSDADVLAANDLAQRAAIAIDNARLYEAARAANRAKDEFLATVSHELRSPLNAMLGWAQLLRLGSLPDTKRETAARAIERNALAQAELIDDLLDMSRMASDKMQLEISSVELGPIVEAAIESLEPEIQGSGVSVRSASEGSAMLMADPKRVQQIVHNLLGNAVKFTPRGGHVDVSLIATDDAVTLSVVDDGVGISREFLPQVFDRFKQADGSSSRAHQGLGLGLAITRHLVELHGATIDVASDGPGRGACFTVVFPRSRAVAGALHEHPPSAESKLEGCKVLVVDDEADVREVLVTILEQSGARATSATSAAEALAAITRARPDVLLSDLGMPGEDGYSLIRKLRALPTVAGGGIPAIAVSGFAGLEYQRRALAAGFQLYLTKPVNVGQLVASITSLRGAQH